MIDRWGISCEIAIKWMLQELADNKSTLVQVMAWYHQATSHHLSQCWPKSVQHSSHFQLHVFYTNVLSYHFKGCHTETWTKWLPFCRWHFQLHFSERKLISALQFKFNCSLSLILIFNNSALVQDVPRCHASIRSNSCSGSMLPYRVSRPQWVK